MSVKNKIQFLEYSNCYRNNMDSSKFITRLPKFTVVSDTPFLILFIVFVLITLATFVIYCICNVLPYLSYNRQARRLLKRTEILDPNKKLRTIIRGLKRFLPRTFEAHLKHFSSTFEIDFQFTHFLRSLRTSTNLTTHIVESEWIKYCR